MTVIFEITCLIAGSAIALYVHLRERTLSGPERPSVAATPVVAARAAGPDRPPDSPRVDDALGKRIRRALGGGKPRTKRSSALASHGRKDAR